MKVSREVFKISIQYFLPLGMIGYYLLPLKWLNGWILGIIMLSILFFSQRFEMEIEDIEPIILSSVAVISLSSVYSFYEYWVGGRMPDHWLDKSLFSDIRFRVSGGFINPNTYGMLISMMSPLIIYMGITKKKLYQKIIYLALLSLTFVALLLTYSRGAFVAYCFMVLYLIITFEKRFLFGLMPIAVVGLFTLPQTLVDRIFSIVSFKDSSILYRFEVYETSLEIFKQHWLLGIGFQSFHDVYGRYGENAYHAHNFILTLLVQVGIIGTALIIGLMIKGLRQCFVCHTIFKEDKNQNKKYVLSVCMFASTLAFLIYGIFDFPFAIIETYMYIFILIFIWIILIGIKKPLPQK